MFEFEELDRLFDKYLEGVASAEELAALERLILSADAAADRSAEWSLAHRQISELITEQSLHEMMSQYVEGARELPRVLIDGVSATSELAVVEDANSAAGSKRGRRLLAGLLLAGAAAAAVLFLATRPGNQHRDRVAFRDVETVAPASVPAPSTEAAATVTRLDGAVWAKDCPAVRCGQQLNEGTRLALASGLMKVTFDCGAEVMLQGPCDFTVRDKMVGVLKHGKIAANVPRRAFSFAVLSPGVDFVDLGTSFGVSVDDLGQSDLRVFEGEVLCSPNGGAKAQRGEAIHVEANDALAFTSIGDHAISSTDEVSYSPLRALRNTTSMKEAPFDGAELALWLKADVCSGADEQGRVASWQDVLYGGNRAGEDATQVEEAHRPRLVHDAIHGRPAVRFDGESNYLVTTPLETTDNQTVLLVCQFSQSALDKNRKWGGQIINYDGPPGREASDMMAPGVLQIGEPLAEGDFRPTALSAQVFAGFVGTAVIEAGRSDAPPVGAGRPVVIAYRYDYARGKSELAVNGQVVSESRAFAPQSLTSRKIIGRHAWKDLFFHGDIGELMIFNEALSDSKLADATAYLAAKYDVTLDSPLKTADASKN